MEYAPFVEEDPLEPGLRAAFGRIEKPVEGDSVYGVHRTCGAMHKCISLRQEPLDIVERVSTDSSLPEMPAAITFLANSRAAASESSSKATTSNWAVKSR